MNSMDVPSVDRTAEVTIGRDGVTPSVIDIGAEAIGVSEVRAEQTVGEGGEPSRRKKKLNKEERAAKRARRAERKAKKAAETATEAHATKEDVQETAVQFGDEDVAAVIIKRRRAKGKLKINENRVESQVEVFDQQKDCCGEDVVRVTNKNANIMRILEEEVGVMPTIEAVGPYYPKLSYAVLKPIAYPSLLYNIIESQHSNIITTADVEGPFLGILTIIPKLLQGTHVADIPLSTIETGTTSGAVLEARLRSLEDDRAVSDSEADASQK
ncbi:hypothetical protein LIER_21842 [Lithospermum erythrorhizon]|uniref:Uncharacterized protein n=1 Tax=Lithospermum erythrorhizon TaxID=34254 RepID=A0AAV3QUU3_LITER